MMNYWKDVKVLIVDEISMATVSLINKLNDYLNHFKRSTADESCQIPVNMIFGGYSIIFSGDFRQIPPVRVPPNEILYCNPGLWENSINVAIMLENSHRFKGDDIFCQILKRMWDGEFTESDINVINERLVTKDLKLPEVNINDDISYACSKNEERTALHASIFQKHIKDFPSFDSDLLPPEHTVIIEADILNAPDRKPRKNSQHTYEDDGTPKAAKAVRVKIDDVMKSLIYARLGDSEVRCDRKLVDPALKLYVGAHCMINDNDDIKEGRANGSMCRVVSIQRKSSCVMKLRNYDGKKVYSLNVNDVEYIEFEHFPKTNQQKKLQDEINLMKASMLENKLKFSESELEDKVMKLDDINKSRRFKLKPNTFNVTFFYEDLKKIASYQRSKELWSKHKWFNFQ